MEQDIEHDQGPTIPGNHGMMTGGSEPDLDQQVHIEIGIVVDPDIGERSCYDQNHREQREEITYACEKFQLGDIDIDNEENNVYFTGTVNKSVLVR